MRGLIINQYRAATKTIATNAPPVGDISIGITLLNFSQ